MAVETRNWGFGGTDKHNGALLPKKRVVPISGIHAHSTARTGDIPAMLKDAIEEGKEPKTVRYGGSRWNSTLFGINCCGKYFSLNLVHDETMEDGELELE